ncbi:MAG: hypothetical protein AAB225_09730 [Acidobacteriota bacterium]
MKTRNITLALPNELLRRLKVIAAQRAMLRDLRRGYDLGTRGKIAWSRDSLHER